METRLSASAEAFEIGLARVLAAGHQRPEGEMRVARDQAPRHEAEPRELRQPRADAPIPRERQRSVGGLETSAGLARRGPADGRGRDDGKRLGAHRGVPPGCLRRAEEWPEPRRRQLPEPRVDLGRQVGAHGVLEQPKPRRRACEALREAHLQDARAGSDRPEVTGREARGEGLAAAHAREHPSLEAPPGQARDALPAELDETPIRQRGRDPVGGGRVVEPGAAAAAERHGQAPEPIEDAAEPETPLAIAVTRRGFALRFSLRSHREPSTRSGRKYARPPKGDEVVYVAPVEEGDAIACATFEGRALLCDAEEVSLLSGAGKGVYLIKLQGNDQVVAAQVLGSDSDALIVQRDGGSEYRVTRRKYELVSRAGKGFSLFKRGKVSGVVYQEPTLPGFPAPEDD